MSSTGRPGSWAREPIPDDPPTHEGTGGGAEFRGVMSEGLHELEDHFETALTAADLDRALGLAHRIGQGRSGRLTLDQALRPTELMIARGHPRSAAAVDRWREHFRAERNPRRVEDEIAEAALRGLREPRIAGFCLRILRLTIGTDTSP